MSRKILCIGFFCLLSATLVFGQEKYEKESRIKLGEAPLLARQFLDSLNFNRKIKWYMEESLNGKSIEAKSKYQKQRYSIEFDTLGNLQDVEMEIKWDHLSNPLKDSIKQNLKKEFEKFKFIKIQEQLTGSRSDIISYLLKRKEKIGLTTRYEIVLKGVAAGQVDLFEYTFAESGSIEKRAKVIFRNTDNLEY